jgi:superfamily II DNA or RNA helicase
MIEQNTLQKLLGENGLKNLKSKFIFTHINKIGKKIYTKQMISYKILNLNNNFYLNLPRFCDFDKLFMEIYQKKNPKQDLPKISCANKIISGVSILSSSLEELVDLEEYQEIVVKWLLENIYTEHKIALGTASCIFVMDTGLGKSFIGCKLIEKFKQKTLIVIPNKSNIGGWKSAIEMYLPDLVIGEYHSGCQKDGQVVIMTIDSVIKSQIFGKPYYEYLKTFGFVIYDEIHNYPTTTYVEVFWRTCFKYCLGLTATPNERADEMDCVYYKHVGQVVNAKQIPGFQDLIKETLWKGKVDVIEYYGSDEFTKEFRNTNGWIDTTNMLKQFTKDPDRTEIIINLIKQKLSENRNIFVFAVHRDFLEEIYEKLKKVVDESQIIPEMTTLMGGSTETQHKIAKETAQVILTTYSFGKESISIKRMDTILFAQPIRNRMRQTIGRILRKGGDESIIREIIDIRDMGTSLKSQFSTRKLIYEEKGFTIKKIKVTLD